MPKMHNKFSTRICYLFLLAKATRSVTTHSAFMATPTGPLQKHKQFNKNISIKKNRNQNKQKKTLK